jgi:hypothetical protein
MGWPSGRWWSAALLAGAVSLLPMVAAADSLSLASNRLTTLTSCGLMSYPSAASLTNDVFVNQLLPDMNNVGNSNLTVSSAALNNSRAYVRFPLSSCLNPIPVTATVRSATLRLFASALAVTCRTVDLFTVLAGWSDTTITWNNEPFGPSINNPVSGQRIASTQIGGGPCTNQTVNAYVNVDVTTDVAKFVAGTSTNNGWMLRDDVEGSVLLQSNSFASRRVNIAAQAPTLMVSYTP